MRIKAKDIQLGMILKENVVAHNGQVLLEQGLALAAEHLRALKTWGIQYVDVEGEAGEADSGAALDIDSPEVAAAKQHLDERFKFTKREHQLIEELYDFRLASMLADDKGN